MTDGRSVRGGLVKRADVIREVPRVCGQVQRQRVQPARVPVAGGPGKGGRFAVRVRRGRLAYGRYQRVFRAETHERPLVEQEVRLTVGIPHRAAVDPEGGPVQNIDHGHLPSKITWHNVIGTKK